MTSTSLSQKKGKPLLGDNALPTEYTKNSGKASKKATRYVVFVKNTVIGYSPVPLDCKVLLN